MGVDVYWRDESGKELDHVLDSPSWFARALNGVQNPPSATHPVMLTIDVYGNTVVISPRTDSLAKELENVRARTPEPEARILLGEICSLARAAYREATSTAGATNRSPN